MSNPCRWQINEKKTWEEREGYCTYSPLVLLTIEIKDRFFVDAILLERLTDIVLVFKWKGAFFPIETIISSTTKVGYQLLFQRLKVLARNFIKQVADSPRHTYLLCRLKIRTLFAIGRDAQRIDNADHRIVWCIVNRKPDDASISLLSYIEYWSNADSGKKPKEFRKSFS